MKRFLWLALALVLSTSAEAQNSRARVVATCGTPPVTYTAGGDFSLTQNTDGELCTGAAGGGGGGDASAANQDEQTTELQQIEADVEATETAVDGLEALVGTTNTNTSTTATNTGTTATNTGTSATNTGNSATSLAIVDDWDETDRAKVNPIVGQAGVAGGTGASGATVQRVAIADIGVGEYESVAASQTGQALGATGAAGDYLLHLTCSPATTSPGVVTVINNSANRVAFAGGASSVSNLVPFTIVVNAYAVTDAWTITTGTNISCLAVGNFT